MEIVEFKENYTDRMTGNKMLTRLRKKKSLSEIANKMEEVSLGSEQNQQRRDNQTGRADSAKRTRKRKDWSEEELNSFLFLIEERDVQKEFLAKTQELVHLAFELEKSKRGEREDL